MKRGENNMDKSWYCPNCDEFTETKVIEKEQTLSVKGKKITLTVPVRVCAHCGEEIIDEELDGNTLNNFMRRIKNRSSYLLRKRYVIFGQDINFHKLHSQSCSDLGKKR